MNVRLTALFVAIASLATVAVNAQEPIEHHAHSSSVIRPVSYGLWDDYDGGCGHRHGVRGGCCGPIGCPYGVGASCGCGGCNKGCNYRIACGLPLVINRITRPLDCLFPCRPKLLGHCKSGWGGCSPCHDPSCGGGCPRPIFARKFGGFGGCAKCDSSVACNLDCSCGTPAATFGPPSGMPVPAPMPDSKVNPFQDDVPEPMPTDARRSARTPSHFSNGPTPARRPATNRSASANPESMRVHVTARPIQSSRVQTAGHSMNANAQVRQASAEGDLLNDYTRARVSSLQPVPSDDDIPLNPLR